MADVEVDKGEKGFVVSGFHALVVFEKDGKTHVDRWAAKERKKEGESLESALEKMTVALSSKEGEK